MVSSIPRTRPAYPEGFRREAVRTQRPRSTALPALRRTLVRRGLERGLFVRLPDRRWCERQLTGIRASAEPRQADWSGPINALAENHVRKRRLLRAASPRAMTT